MKILMLSNTYLPVVGGLENSICSFVTQLKKKGHDVKIAVPQFEGLDAQDPSLVVLPAIPKRFREVLSVAEKMPEELKVLMANWRPDVLHAHHPFLIGETAVILSTIYNCPLVYTQHIMFDQYAHYLPIPSVAAKRFLVKLSAGFANLCARVVAPSESVKKALGEEGVSVPIEIVPTGVDLDVFSKADQGKIRKELGVPEEAFMAGYVGRLASEKNLDFLTGFTAEFLRKDKRAHFLVAGIGPLEKAIQDRFHDPELAGRFHFMGPVAGQRKVDVYHALDVFLFTSKSETQGLVVCEAMASGVPVLALDAPGVREMVRDYENGRLLMEESPQKFIHALEWFCMRSPDAKNALRRNAFQTAQEFSVERCTQKLVEVYAHAMDAVPAAVKHFSPKHDQYWRKQMQAEWRIFTNVEKSIISAVT